MKTELNQTPCRYQNHGVYAAVQFYRGQKKKITKLETAPNSVLHLI
jgi:hypothetical protein